MFGACGAVVVGLAALGWPFIAPALRRHCLPFVPASDAQVRHVVEALALPIAATKPAAAHAAAHAAQHTAAAHQRTFVDLGSGDGRIVLAAGRALRRPGVGVELNPWLVAYSTYKAWTGGLRGVSRFRVQDLWAVDYARYDDVVVFGVAEMMGELRGKLARELQPHARVIACRFQLPGAAPVAVIGEGIEAVWVYPAAALAAASKSL